MKLKLTIKTILVTFSVAITTILISSCNGKIKNDRKLYGIIVDSTGKVVSKRDFYLRATEDKGFMFNHTERWQSFKFTTNDVGYFNVTYSSQKKARVAITNYNINLAGGEEGTAHWQIEPVPNDNYNAGTIKLKE